MNVKDMYGWIASIAMTMAIDGIVTANKRGRTTMALNEISERFVEYACTASGPVLDIGCAYGVASLAALERGATVIANDIEPVHLGYVEANAPIGTRDALTTMLGRFPREIDFEYGSLAAVHASNLLNFLRGTEIEDGAAKIAHWLMPGGKVFVISGTPYAGNITGFIPTYERRRAEGVRWPGECEKLSNYSSDPTIRELPDFLHLLDDSVLRRTFEAAGLIVEEAEMIHLTPTSNYINYDGRENVKLIAKKT